MAVFPTGFLSDGSGTENIDGCSSSFDRVDRPLLIPILVIGASNQSSPVMHPPDLRLRLYLPRRVRLLGRPLVGPLECQPICIKRPLPIPSAAVCWLLAPTDRSRKGWRRPRLFLRCCCLDGPAFSGLGRFCGGDDDGFLTVVGVEFFHKGSNKDLNAITKSYKDLSVIVPMLPE
ncbi:hypothetical protein EJB05_32998, partial [Eragrostis curvula]